jgi:hydroxyacylglutathione hydrolase
VFIEKIKSEGLAHLSYLGGSAGRAFVVDPRRDCEVYVKRAAAHGCRITHVFETHRNEDLLSGAAVLARETGAVVYHGPNAAGDVQYAQTIRDGDEFSIGRVRIRVLETPGHTDDSISLVLADADFGDDAVAVFTGDALFIGDVGRTDFYPDRAREVAGLLFDSLRRLEALGDHVVVYPAHGAGSVCGSGMAKREVSTIGYEKANNARLRIRDRDAFVQAKLDEHHELPPYFEAMEAGNLSGAAPVKRNLAPPPLTADEVVALGEEVALLDLRDVTAWLGSHVPGSLSLPVAMIPAFAGWLLEPSRPLVLIADEMGQAALAARYLARIGYDEVRGCLADGLPSWAAGGRAFGTISAVGVEEVRARSRSAPAQWTLLDVRGADEVAAARVPKSQHIYLGELPERLGELDRDHAFTVMCGSGVRATIAASLLARNGFGKLDVFMGSMGAWQAGDAVQGD